MSALSSSLLRPPRLVCKAELSQCLQVLQSLPHDNENPSFALPASRLARVSEITLDCRNNNQEEEQVYEKGPNPNPNSNPIPQQLQPQLQPQKKQKPVAFKAAPLCSALQQHLSAQGGCVHSLTLLFGEATPFPASEFANLTMFCFTVLRLNLLSLQVEKWVYNNHSYGPLEVIPTTVMHAFGEVSSPYPSLQTLSLQLPNAHMDVAGARKLGNFLSLCPSLHSLRLILPFNKMQYEGVHSLALDIQKLRDLTSLVLNLAMNSLPDYALVPLLTQVLQAQQTQQQQAHFLTRFCADCRFSATTLASSAAFYNELARFSRLQILQLSFKNASVTQDKIAQLADCLSQQQLTELDLDLTMNSLQSELLDQLFANGIFACSNLTSLKLDLSKNAILLHRSSPAVAAALSNLSHLREIRINLSSNVFLHQQQQQHFEQQEQVVEEEPQLITSMLRALNESTNDLLHFSILPATPDKHPAQPRSELQAKVAARTALMLALYSAKRRLRPFFRREALGEIVERLF